MTKLKLKLLIQMILLQIKILQIQLQIKLFKQKRTVPNLKWPTKVILHHGGGWLDFKGVNALHKKKWGFKSSLGFHMGYTWFIERSGRIIQARRDNEKGAHTKGYNERTIGIGLAGNGTEKPFTKEQMKSLKYLVDTKLREYNIPRSEFYAHRNFANTICPSDILYAWVLAYK